MTATPPTPTAAPQGWGATARRRRPAGVLFGIDLKGLFEDDDEGGEGLSGFVPTKSTYKLKGQSPRTLTYKGASTPTREVTQFELAPSMSKLPSATEPTKPAEPAEPAEKADRLLSSFITDMGDPSKKVLGAQGLGAAMEYGYSPEEVKSMAKTEGMTFGEQAAKSLGLSELSQYQTPLATGKTIGYDALQSARQAGMSDQLIKQVAQQQGVGFGAQAAAQLGVPKVSNLSQYIDTSAGGSPGTLGLTAVNAAQKAGLTPQQITTMAEEQGLGFGAQAASQLNVPKTTDLSQYIDFGAGGNVGTLGLTALNSARSRGLSDIKIMQLAASQGLSFGKGARESLGLY